MRIKLYFLGISFLLLNCKQSSDFTDNYLCKYDWLYVDDINDEKVIFINYNKFDENGNWDHRVIKTNERYLGEIYKWSYENNILNLADEFHFKILSYNNDSIVMLNDKNKKVYFLNLKSSLARRMILK